MTASDSSTLRQPRTSLRISATTDLASLAILVVNLATVNAPEVAALIGPVHGLAWLFGIIATWRDPHRTRAIAACSVIPGIGGLLALRALDQAESTADRAGASH